MPPAQRTPRETSSAKPQPNTPAAPPPSAPPAAVPPAAAAPAAAGKDPAASPQIQLVPAVAQGALDAAEEAVDLLLESGRTPGDILVITTGEPHPWATHELSFGKAAYWAQHDAGDDVFYAGAADADRALTRPVVVVAVNGGTDETTGVALPLARSRAGELLIVCGDPQRVNAVLGAGV